MTASATDHRQLKPLLVDRADLDLRRCRNCGDQFEVGMDPLNRRRELSA